MLQILGDTTLFLEFFRISSEFFFWMNFGVTLHNFHHPDTTEKMRHSRNYEELKKM